MSGSIYVGNDCSIGVSLGTVLYALLVRIGGLFLREGGVYVLCLPGGVRVILRPFPACYLVLWGGVLTIC